MGYIYEHPDCMCIVMHWCESSLYKLIHIRNQLLPLPQALRISREIAQVLFINGNFMEINGIQWNSMEINGNFILNGESQKKT